MRLFKKTGGLNPLDSPSRRNIDSIVKSPDTKNKNAAVQRRASFKITEESNVQNSNALNSGRVRPKRNMLMNDSKGAAKSPKKKMNWLKRIKGKKKSKEKETIYSNNRDRDDQDLTVTSTLSSQVSPHGPDSFSKYFSTPTEGFECILEDEIAKKFATHNREIDNRSTEQQQTDQTSQCVTVTPFDNWENFVSLLTSTNETVKTSMYAANETMKKYLLSDNNIYDATGNQCIVDEKDILNDATNNKNNRQMHQSKPMKEVEYFSECLPFDEMEESVTTNFKPPQDSTASEQLVRDAGVNYIATNNTLKAAAKTTLRKNTVPKTIADIDGGIKQRAAAEQRVVEQSAVEQKATEPNRNRSQIKDQDQARYPMPYEVPDLNSPLEEVFDSTFTLSFLRDVSSVGILLTYFKLPSGEENTDEMHSSLVNLTIKPGVSRGSRLLEPRLFWTDMNDIASSKKEEYSISLLSIHSIHTSLSEGDDDQTQFFTITTEKGEVHAFEAPTTLERHNVVNGIKNVVAWLSYHLVMGNMASGTELVSNLDEQQGEESGELPSLKTPAQAMNELSHVFLD